MWYRDVLLCKATNEIKHLIFTDKVQYIRKIANESTYEEMERIVALIQETKLRITYNVNKEIAIQWLLLVCVETDVVSVGGL